MAGLALVVFFAVAAALIGLLSPHDPVTWRSGEQYRDSSWGHWLGTDNSGRDILTRLFFGARISLLIGVACVAFSGVVGLPLGAVAGYFGGATDAAISRLLDILLVVSRACCWRSRSRRHGRGALDGESSPWAWSASRSSPARCGRACCRCASRSS
jgi:ABC-type dipeptide/oligopeptide/nickel transport system permease subunit